MLKKIIGGHGYAASLSFSALIARISLLFVSFLLLVVSIANAQTIPLDKQVRKGILPNGFTYYIRHNESPQGRVVFNLVVKVGSIVEDDDQSGMAHFIEHMSFNGTKHFPKNQLVDYLQRNGLRFGADINAYTGFDETVYQLPLTNSPAILKKGLLIIRDWAQDATLATEEIDKERGVILEEKRTQMGPGQRIQQQYTPMLFNASRYADRDPIGTDSSLRYFNPSALRRFYKDWYRPDLQGIIAVGDFDVVEMEKMIRNNFSSLKNPSVRRPRQKYRIELNGKDSFMALKDAEMNTAMAQIIIKHQSPEMKTEEDYRLAVIRRLLNTVMAKRFRTLVTSDSSKVLQASVSIGELMGGLDNFSVNLVAKPAGLAEGVTEVWAEIERMRKFGFKAEELEQAKDRYANGMKNGLMEKDKISSDSFAKEYVAHFLRGDLAPGMDTEYKLVMKFLSEVTIADLDKMAAAYIRKDNRNIIVTGSANETLPTKEKFELWMAKAETSIAALGVGRSSGKSGAQSTKALLRLQPVAGKVVSVVKSADGISTVQLSNRITVVLKPTNFRNDEIIFSGFAAGGTSLSSDADYYSAKNAASIVSSSGAGNYSRKELEEYLSAKQMGVQPFISEFSQGIAGGGTAGNIGKALELAYAYLTEPVIDKVLFEKMINRTRVAVAGRDKNPEVVFQDSISAILSGYHPRRIPITAKKIDQIELERVYQIYKERFADNTGMTFSFVGSFDIDSLKPLLEKYIGSLPTANKKGSYKDPGIGLPAANINKVIKKGLGAKARVELFYSGLFSYGQKERMTLDALRGVLELTLTERLREQESGVYSPSVSLSMDKIPHKEFKLGIAFECAPENTERLISAALDEVAKLRATGPSALNLQKYKMESVRSREIEIKTNQWWLGYLSGQLQDGESLSAYKLFLKNLNNLDAAQLKLSAKRYLNNENLSRFVLLPESTDSTN